MADTPAHVRIIDVGLYPNLSPALGTIVGCIRKELTEGYYMYHVPASTFIDLGCNVGRDNEPFPFYATEVDVISTG